MAAPRVIASLAAAGAAVRTRIRLEREGTAETIRDVRAPDLWAALEELLVLQSLRETEGAQAVELSLDQAVVNRALATSAVEKLLRQNRLRSLDVAFAPGGLVVGVVLQLGPLRLPRRQYTLGVAARRGGLEIDLAEVLGIPVAGPRIAAMLDAKAEALGWLSIRRRGHVLAIAYPGLRCERVACGDGTLHLTVTAGDAPPRAPRPRRPPRTV